MKTHTIDHAEFAREVVQTLRSHGFEALWAGGCVRDLLLGRSPKDYDVATNARPEQVRQVFGHRRTLPIGVAFGVIIVLGPRGAQPVEVATFRCDGEYLDGRHPEGVTFSTAAEDAQRRDFTINGLFYDPVEQRTWDYVDGQRDLAQRVVRAIGNPEARFHEDKLRMLRAVRFAATFDFSLDPATAAAIRRAPDRIRQVSAERIAAEMRRMLVHVHRVRAVRLLVETGLLSEILPQLPHAENPPLLPEARASRPSEVGLHILEGLDADTTFATALAAFLAAIVEPTTSVTNAVLEAVGAHWRLTRHEASRVAWLTKTIPLLLRADQLPWPQLQRILIHDGIVELLDWLQAHVRAGQVDMRVYALCQQRLALPIEQLNPQPLLDGNDLHRHGVPQGKLYQILLDLIRDEQLDGRLVDKQGALAWVDAYLSDRSNQREPPPR